MFTPDYIIVSRRMFPTQGVTFTMMDHGCHSHIAPQMEEPLEANNERETIETMQ